MKSANRRKDRLERGRWLILWFGRPMGSRNRAIIDLVNEEKYIFPFVFTNIMDKKYPRSPIPRLAIQQIGDTNRLYKRYQVNRTFKHTENCVVEIEEI